MDENKYKDYAKELIDKSLNISTEELLEKRELYALLKAYVVKNNKNPEDDYSDIVPEAFDLSDDIKAKKEILKEAIENNKLINETTNYQSIIEGIKSRS